MDHEHLKKLLPVRFYDSINFQDSPLCWDWLRSVDRYGYGRYSYQGKYVAAHRLSFTLLIGEIPKDRILDHTCFNKSCVNPNHLRPVTHQQNSHHLMGANPRNSTSGIRNVTWNKRLKKWQVQVRNAGKDYYGGIFESLEDAEEMAIALRSNLFSHDDGRKLQ